MNDNERLNIPNIVWHQHRITKQDRALKNQQRPVILWFTGLSGSGKSTLAGALETALFELGARSYLLDGDNVRHGLNQDLGFDDASRVENIRRIAEVSKLMLDAGLIVLTAFISPFRADRALARSLVDEGAFIEVFIDTPLSICEARDPKGLYRKARAGEIRQFTGIDSPYEIPETSEITLDTNQSIEDNIATLLAYLRQHHHLPS